ncbi:MAG: phosphate signaling complex protein PhoU [Bacteroidetes bacterium]|nr:phosphate signaling complex protein PhoU [Bacteroidota bacterium]
MTHLDTELHLLKEQLIDMQRLVRAQIGKCKNALVQFDHGLAREVLELERKINSLELKTDRDCENILALFNPVAVDLRFILAALKINTNLERIGDNAEGIARYVLDVKTPFPEELITAYRFDEMYKTAVSMLDDSLEAFITENTTLARDVFAKDDLLDEINLAATQTTLKLIGSAQDPLHCLNMLSIIRKLERVGDQTKNIAEEIIFFVEAKVLKHESDS